jgi:hypothetical protein
VICPFTSFKSPFHEAFDVHYGKATRRLIIFFLLDAGKGTNLTATIDATLFPICFHLSIQMKTSRKGGIFTDFHSRDLKNFIVSSQPFTL